MPLTASSLSTRIVNEIISREGAPTDPAKLENLADAIAAAVVDEITMNGETTTIIGSGSSSGIWPGTIT